MQLLPDIYGGCVTDSNHPAELLKLTAIGWNFKDQIGEKLVEKMRVNGEGSQKMRKLHLPCHVHHLPSAECGERTAESEKMRLTS